MVQNYKLLGTACAERGPYTFYKAFKYHKSNIGNIIKINDFFFVKLWSDSDLISIGELRLLWQDKTTDRTLASLRLYVLPENTPDGRITDMHGQDEVVCITEKVVINLCDLLTWITESADWSWGQALEHVRGRFSNIQDNGSIPSPSKNTLVDCSVVDYTDIHKEKQQLDAANWGKRTGVLVLSYSRYCRYRAIVKRLEGITDEWVKARLVTSLTGFDVSCRTTRILYCRDTFDYPDIEGHELLCNHLAPKLRSRIPKKRKMLYSSSPEICSSEDDNGLINENSSMKNSLEMHFKPIESAPSIMPTRRSPRTLPDNLEKQKIFNHNLFAFMKARNTPISRIPSIGYKEINLFEFYNKVTHLGGHVGVTTNKLWKYVFEVMGGEQGNSSAGSLTRRHYERLLLPYEQFMSAQSSSRNQLKDTEKNNQNLKENSDQTEAVKPKDKENIPIRFAADDKEEDRDNISGVIDLCSPTKKHPHLLGAEGKNLTVDNDVRERINKTSVTLTKKVKLGSSHGGELEVTAISRLTSDTAKSLNRDRIDITITPDLPLSPHMLPNSKNNNCNTPYLPTFTGKYQEHRTEKLDIPKPSVELFPIGVSRQGKQTCDVLDLTLKNENLAKKLCTDKVNAFPGLGPNIEVTIVPTTEKVTATSHRKQRKALPALRPLVPLATYTKSRKTSGNSSCLTGTGVNPSMYLAAAAVYTGCIFPRDQLTRTDSWDFINSLTSDQVEHYYQQICTNQSKSPFVQYPNNGNNQSFISLYEKTTNSMKR